MIDLRSDTVTKPSPGMVTAMARAEVGDDVYGEDPTVAELEATVAEILGQEAALFTVTGSLANLLGVRALVPPGRELLAESRSHVVRAELGAHAALSGVTTRTWSDPAGLIDLDQIRGLIAPDLGPYFVTTAAVSVENTHNFGGGSIQSREAYGVLVAELDRQDVALHLDGARLWNASVATGDSPATLARGAAAVSVCFSKGLGAPVGSAVAGSRELIAEARVWRKRLGAGWRQAGVLAAAALYAVRNNVDRLAEDHAKARAIADILADGVPGSVKPEAVETNIVVAEVPDAPRVVAAARDEGILVGSVGACHLRLVTHLDVSLEESKHAAQTIARLVAAPR